MKAIFDHVAVEVEDIDACLETLVDHLGMRLLRSGSRHLTGERIVLLGDGTGVKVELIESRKSGPSLAHLAFRVDDLHCAYSELIERGLTSQSSPHPLPAAHADTALVSDDSGLRVQIISYQPGSPDMVTWTLAADDTEAG